LHLYRRLAVSIGRRVVVEDASYLLCLLFQDALLLLLHAFEPVLRVFLRVRTEEDAFVLQLQEREEEQQQWVQQVLLVLDAQVHEVLVEIVVVLVGQREAAVLACVVVCLVVVVVPSAAADTGWVRMGFAASYSIASDTSGAVPVEEHLSFPS